MSGTVTITQGGSTDNGTDAYLAVVTGQAVSPIGNTASATNTTPSLSITPAATGSWVYGANLGLAGTYTANGSTVYKRTGSSAGLEYLSLRSASTTTASTPVTIGGTAGVNSISIALQEILAGTGLAEYSASPGGFGTSTTSAVSASFNPPPGSLLVLMAQTNGGAGTTTLSVTDTLGLGLTWTEQVKQNSAGNGYCGVWTAIVPSPITANDQPWQFRPETYGALGDGVVITDAVMTNGSPNLAATTSAPFTSTAVDSGKYVLVSTAGGGTYSPKMFTISTVTDTGHAVLSANASSSTGGTPGAIAYFGTDDTDAIQDAIDAATTYAQAHGGYAEVLFSDKIYIVAGSFVTGGGTLGNFQIQLPIIDPATGVQVIIALKGPRETAPLMHWDQVTPQYSGAVLASVRTDGTDDATYGPACMVGGPFHTYGGEPGTYSNCVVRVQGLGVLVPYNATMSGIDTFGYIEADFDGVSAMTAAVVPTSSAPVPSLSTPGNISNQWTYGLRWPSAGNQTVCLGREVSAEGFCYDLGVSEWTHIQDGHAMYGIGAVGLYSGNGVSMVHNAVIDWLQAENCTNAIIQVDSGIKRILATIGTESISASNHVYDPSNLIYGEVVFMAENSAGSSNNFANGHGLNLRILNKMTPPGTVGPPTVPGSGTAYTNHYGRNAIVSLTSGGAAVTAITLADPGGTTIQTGLTLGTTGSVLVPVPVGYSITLTYAGAAPTWQWGVD